MNLTNGEYVSDILITNFNYLIYKFVEIIYNDFSNATFNLDTNSEGLDKLIPSINNA